MKRNGCNRLPIERLHFLARMLRAGMRVTTLIGATRFEVSRRTISRDIEFLCDRLHYDIEWNNHLSSYRLLSAPDPQL